jgi:mRNA interferase HigB
MHLIAIRNLRADAAQYPDVKKQIDAWYATVKKAEWQNLEDVRKIYRDAEAVGNFTVFNIKGNDYRLIVGIDYERPNSLLQILFNSCRIRQRQVEK